MTCLKGQTLTALFHVITTVYLSHVFCLLLTVITLDCKFALHTSVCNANLQRLESSQVGVYFYLLCLHNICHETGSVNVFLSQNRRSNTEVRRVFKTVRYST